MQITRGKTKKQKQKNLKKKSDLSSCLFFGGFVYIFLFFFFSPVATAGGFRMRRGARAPAEGRVSAVAGGSSRAGRDAALTAQPSPGGPAPPRRTEGSKTALRREETGARWLHSASAEIIIRVLERERGGGKRLVFRAGGVFRGEHHLRVPPPRGPPGPERRKGSGWCWWPNPGDF